MWCLKCCKEIVRDNFIIIEKYNLCNRKEFDNLLSAICFLKNENIASNIFGVFIKNSNKYYIFINNDINLFNKNMNTIENIINNAKILDSKIKQDLIKL